MRSVISVYVENKYGVLARVSGLFMRRGFNIDSLAVGETEDANYSRITITLNGDDYAREQLINQVKKLHNVKKVKLLEPEVLIERELMLIKIKNTEENKRALKEAIGSYNAKLAGDTDKAICVEVTGEPAELNAFISTAKPLGIIEMCRTGAVALQRGGSIMEK